MIHIPYQLRAWGLTLYQPCGNESIDPGEECDGGLGCTDCLCDATFEPTAPSSVDCQLLCGNEMVDLNDDADGDGVIDDCDACPDSLTGKRLIIDGCHTRAANTVFDDGCTMADLAEQCLAGGKDNNGVACVTDLARRWRRDDLITPRQFGRIISCAARTHREPRRDGRGLRSLR